MKTFFFSESSHVTYQINWNGAKSTMQAHILSLLTPSISGVGSKGQNSFFLNVVMLHIKLKRKNYRPAYKKKTSTLHTLLTLGQVESQILNLYNTKIVDRLLIMICMIPKLEK